MGPRRKQSSVMALFDPANINVDFDDEDEEDDHPPPVQQSEILKNDSEINSSEVVDEIINKP